MKKVNKILSLALIFCMAFSMTASAAGQKQRIVPVKEVDNAENYFAGSGTVTRPPIQPKAPAAPITSATVEEVMLDDSNGHVYAIVRVVGIGTAFGYIDGSRVEMSDSLPVGSPIVTGYLFLFDCGQLSSGQHTFRYMGTSLNSPWNTVNAYATFTVP